jgi:hypothetical protein
MEIPPDHTNTTTIGMMSRRASTDRQIETATAEHVVSHGMEIPPDHMSFSPASIGPIGFSNHRHGCGVTRHGDSTRSHRSGSLMQSTSQQQKAEFVIM